MSLSIHQRVCTLLARATTFFDYAMETQLALRGAAIAMKESSIALKDSSEAAAANQENQAYYWARQVNEPAPAASHDAILASIKEGVDSIIKFACTSPDPVKVAETTRRALEELAKDPRPASGTGWAFAGVEKGSEEKRLRERFSSLLGCRGSESCEDAISRLKVERENVYEEQRAYFENLIGGPKGESVEAGIARLKAAR